MRMRKKKHSKERIEACESLLLRMEEKNGLFLKCADADEVSRAVFGCDEARPLMLEIGCGKGDFASGMSAAYPQNGMIALERVADVAVIALEKASASLETGERTDNLRFIIGNAQNLSEWFPESSFKRIFVNFCDPWPKSGYSKRRLTAPGFLKLYRHLLVDGGELWFKTDNEPLFDWSVEQFKEAGLEFSAITRDLHASPMADGNIMTEYERNFSSRGMPIFSARLRFKKQAEEKAND